MDKPRIPRSRTRDDPNPADEPQDGGVDGWPETPQTPTPSEASDAHSQRNRRTFEYIFDNQIQYRHGRTPRSGPPRSMDSA